MTAVFIIIIIIIIIVFIKFASYLYAESTVKWPITKRSQHTNKNNERH